MTDYGNLKPDDDLTEIFTKVVKDVSEDDYGSVKAGANTALLLTLRLLQYEDPDAVQYHLSRQGCDDLQGLRDAVRTRQQQDFVLDVDDVLTTGMAEGVDDSGFSADLQDAEPDDDEDDNHDGAD